MNSQNGPSTNRCLTLSCSAVYTLHVSVLPVADGLAPPPHRRPVGRPPDDEIR